MARILIVDDSALSRKLLKRIIDKTEHEVVGEADSGERAILEFRKVNPDVVMMDLDMPGMGGLKASIKIKTHYPAVKIVIVSAHDQSSITNELIQNGINSFISKPIKVEKVINSLNAILAEPASINRDTVSGNKDPEKKTQIITKDLFEGIIIKDGNRLNVSHFSSLQDLKAIILKKEKNESINIKEEFQTKNMAAILKNIGAYELKLRTFNELSAASKIILDMYLDGKAFNISSEVVENVRSEGGYDYKVKVTYIDLGSKRFLISYIQKLKNQVAESVLNLEND